MQKNSFKKLSSFIRFQDLKRSKKIIYPKENIGKEVMLRDSTNYRIFLEIMILSENKKTKVGQFIFKVFFHASNKKPEKIIKWTKFTIPLFAGLPGFCNKKFMVNETERKYSGCYEWESLECARKYANSYAMKFMKKRSKPFPIYYEIIEKSTGKRIESQEV